MDSLYVGLPKLGLQHLEPLDSSKAGINPPLTEAGKHPPPKEVGNQPPQPEVGNELPQGVQPTCPQRERELATADHGSTGPSRRLNGKRVEVRALHTRLVPHRPGGGLSAKFMNLWPARTHLPATSPQRLSKPTTRESRCGW